MRLNLLRQHSPLPLNFLLMLLFAHLHIFGLVLLLNSSQESDAPNGSGLRQNSFVHTPQLISELSGDRFRGSSINDPLPVRAHRHS